MVPRSAPPSPAVGGGAHQLAVNAFLQPADIGRQARLRVPHRQVVHYYPHPLAIGREMRDEGYEMGRGPLADNHRPADRPAASAVQGGPAVQALIDVDRDLRGVRHLFRHSPYASRVAAHIVLDGAGAETAVTQALGSRRYHVTISGPGGHSFTNAGTPNPILVLASALTKLGDAPLNSSQDEPRVTLNVGTIQGGTSVNTIPENATASVEFRSTDQRPLVRLEVALHRAVEDAVEAANAEASTRSGARSGRRDAAHHSASLRYTIEKIGDRPSADLPRDSPLMEAIKAVDRHLGLRTDLRLGSTDANIPLSLGIPAVSLGAGGDGGGAHTRAEWYSAANRELGLRRVLLLTLAMLDWAGKQT